MFLPRSGGRAARFSPLVARIWRIGILYPQLWEIDENLMQIELTELERADHLSRRKDVYIARHPETRHGVAGAHARHGSANADSASASFAEDTAAKTGISQRTVQVAVRRSDRIASDVKAAIADTDIPWWSAAACSRNRKDTKTRVTVVGQVFYDGLTMYAETAGWLRQAA